MASAIASDDYTFEDMVDHPEIMTHHVHKSIKHGDARGYPVLRDDERVPTTGDVYQASTRKKDHPLRITEHKDIPIFRSHSVTMAVADMVNLGLYPIRCSTDTMPNNIEWDNFAEVLYTFHAYYCYYEGLDVTANETRAALLFVFYGTFMWKTKKRKKPLPDGTKVPGIPVARKKTFMFFLNRKMLNGRSRFVNGVQNNFASALSLLQAHPEYKHFLEDKGEGRPPMTYLWAVEVGLRNYASDIFCMGTCPLRSREYWGTVDKWRKREAYISLVRYVTKNGHVSYKNWRNFDFKDFTQRQRCTATFERRHLPRSDGNDGKHFPRVKFDWDKHAYNPRPKKVKPGKYSTPSPATAAESSPAVDTPTVRMRYDVETDAMVPM